MTDRQEVLVLAVRGREWSLPAHLVRQVLPPRRVTRVPGADLPLVGLIAWRARLLCVLSADARPADGRPLLVIEDGENLVALPVDEVKGFVPVHAPEGEQEERRNLPPPLLDLGRAFGEG